LNLDLVAGVSRLPALGETIIGLNFNTYCGGKGANQAVALARLGASVKMIGKLGRMPSPINSAMEWSRLAWTQPALRMRPVPREQLLLQPQPPGQHDCRHCRSERLAAS